MPWRLGASTSRIQAPAAVCRSPLPACLPAFAQVDPTLWRLELERLGPQLRITVAADARDWRGHLDQARASGQALEAGWADAQPQLERLAADVGASLDKLDTRESYLNQQLHHLLMQYQAARQQGRSVQVRAPLGPAGQPLGRTGFSCSPFAQPGRDEATAGAAQLLYPHCTMHRHARRRVPRPPAGGAGAAQRGGFGAQRRVGPPGGAAGGGAGRAGGARQQHGGRLAAGAHPAAAAAKLRPGAALPGRQSCRCTRRRCQPRVPVGPALADLLVARSQVRIKAAIKGVKEELRGMEVRIGVVGHSLLQRGLRERQARIKAGMLAVEASAA